MAISLKPLQDQVIVITGSSSGIGLVTARMAAQKGAKLVLAARNEDALRQVVYGSRTAVNHFKQRKIGSGALINVGSFFGDRATAVQSTYSASKHALHGWTDALRMELEAEGVPASGTFVPMV